MATGIVNAFAMAITTVNNSNDDINIENCVIFGFWILDIGYSNFPSCKKCEKRIEAQLIVSVNEQ